MKRLICVITIVAAVFSCGVTTVWAGDEPENLAHYDSLVFFGEIVSYDETKIVSHIGPWTDGDDLTYNEIIGGSFTIRPTQKIKGDVKIGMEQTYENRIEIYGDPPVKGEIYLMGFYDENNPLYVFNVTSTDTKTLKIIGVDSYWKRFEKYLNNGDVEQAETERLARVNSQQAPISDTIQPSAPPSASSLTLASVAETDNANYWLYGAIGGIGVVVIIGLVMYLRKKSKMQK